MEVTAWELEFHDDYANSHKFYRLYVLPDSYMAHWGRIGTTGQFKVTPSRTPEQEVHIQLYAKENKGYEHTGSRVTFEVNGNFSAPLTRTQQLELSELFRLARYNRHLSGAQVQTKSIDTLEAMQQQALLARQKEAKAKEDKQTADENKLKATLLKITSRAEPESAEPPAAPDNSMEAKLAAAMTRAKEKR